ncbi:MAG: hypothetical protein WDN00_05380 [Limisphaerales bacterium]
MNSPLNPKRTIAELKELRALTGDENGAQRGRVHTDVDQDARVAAGQAGRTAG